MSRQSTGNELSVAIAASPAGNDSAALTTALACHAAGFSDITVYGPSNLKSRSGGASVELSPNASRIVRTLKVLDRLAEAGFEPQFVHQRSYRTGFQLSIQALGAMAEGRYNAPFLHLESEALCNALENTARERGINFAAETIQSLSQTKEGLELGLAIADNRPKNVKHSVLIVASDPDDQIRALAKAEPINRTPTKFCHWQGQVAKERLPAGAFGPVITQWLGPDHHLSYHFGADAQHLQVSAITASDSADSQPTLNASFKHWHPSLGALLEVADNLRGTPVERSVSPERLAHGRVLFLATSCHLLLPHLAQQAALGIEDAWVAARMLEQWEDEPAGGWVEYEKYRLPRARRLQEKAQKRAAELCEPSTSKAWARNLGLSLSSRFLPELAMQKNDWLYGYDAVNGFE